MLGRSCHAVGLGLKFGFGFGFGLTLTLTLTLILTLTCHAAPRAAAPATRQTRSTTRPSGAVLAGAVLAGAVLAPPSPSSGAAAPSLTKLTKPVPSPG